MWGDRETWELFVPSAPFCRELETSLKKQSPREKCQRCLHQHRRTIRGSFRNIFSFKPQDHILGWVEDGRCETVVSVPYGAPQGLVWVRRAPRIISLTPLRAQEALMGSGARLSS